MAAEAGISVWRQVSEALTRDIEAGVIKANERLPKADELAARFSVNRHTIAKVVQHLESEGLIRVERGRGAYAIVNPIKLRLGARTWFEQNLREGNRTPTRTLISARRMAAPAATAAQLQLGEGEPVLFVALRGEADSLPINYVHNYLPIVRLPGIEAYLEQIGYSPTEHFSFTAMFRAAGITDFRRKHIRIDARAPSREEAIHLKMSPSGYVLTTQVLQVDHKDRPIAWAETAYSAGRVSLVMDFD